MANFFAEFFARLFWLLVHKINLACLASLSSSTFDGFLYPDVIHLRQIIYFYLPMFSIYRQSKAKYSYWQSARRFFTNQSNPKCTNDATTTILCSRWYRFHACLLSKGWHSHSDHCSGLSCEVFILTIGI